VACEKKKKLINLQSMKKYTERRDTTSSSPLFITITIPTPSISLQLAGLLFVITITPPVRGKKRAREN
jgi:hypothetical protein